MSAGSCLSCFHLTVCSQFLIPYARHGKTQAQMYDADIGKRLWAYLEEQVKTK